VLGLHKPLQKRALRLAPTSAQLLGEGKTSADVAKVLHIRCPVIASILLQDRVKVGTSEAEALTPQRRG